MAEQRKGRMLLTSRYNGNRCPGFVCDWDTTLSQRSYGTLVCFGWLCLLLVDSSWAKEGVNAWVASSCVQSSCHFRSISHAAWPSHAFTSSLTTATTRRSRPSRPNTALPLQSGPSGSPTHRAVASSSHCQHMEPKGIQARSGLPGSRLLSRGRIDHSHDCRAMFFKLQFLARQG